jgi:FlaG/FlaF family flagellin (archaellin)
MKFSALALAAVILSACLADGVSTNSTAQEGTICPVAGSYITSNRATITITFNGMFFESSGSDVDIYATCDNTMHFLESGVNGTFQSNCNVINWSNGVTYERK